MLFGDLTNYNKIFYFTNIIQLEDIIDRFPYKVKGNYRYKKIDLQKWIKLFNLSDRNMTPLDPS